MIEHISSHVETFWVFFCILDKCLEMGTIDSCVVPVIQRACAIFNLQCTESCSNSISLRRVKASVNDPLHSPSARKARSPRSHRIVLCSHSQCMHGR